MYDWVHIISNQWYITVSTHEIVWFFVNEQKYGEWIMWYCIISIAFRVSTFSCIRSARVLKNVIDLTKMSLILYYFVHPLIYNHTPHYQQSTLMCVIKNMVIILHNNFLPFKFKPIYLKYLKYLQSGPEFERSISNDTLPHIFISEVG